MEKQRQASVSDLTETTFKAHPVFEYRIAWHEDAKEERHVLLIPGGTALYRIIYDPKAPLNKEMLEGLELNRP